MLLDLVRAGVEDDGELGGEGWDDGSTRVTPGGSVRGGAGAGGGEGVSVGGTAAGEAAWASSKAMAKSQQLYDEHASNERRKEQRRKVIFVAAVAGVGPRQGEEGEP